MLGTVGKQSVMSFISAYSGLILGILNKVFLFPLIFKDNDAYWGLLENFISYATIIGALSHFGMPGVLRRFLPGLDQDRDKLYGFVLFVSAIGAFLILVALVFLKPFLVDFIADQANDAALVSEYYFLLVLLVIVMLFFELGTAALVSNAKSHIPVFLNSVVFRLGVSFSILALYLFQFSLESFLYLYISLYILNLVLAIAFLWWRGLIAFNFSLKVEDPKGYMQFGFFAVFASSSGWIINYVDAIFVGKYIGLALIPILAISKYIISVMYIPARAVVNASVPIISRAWKKNDMQALASIYKKTAITEIVVGGIIFTAIWINIDLLLSLIPDKDFKEAKYLVLVLGFGRLADLASGSNSSIIANSKYYRFILISNLILMTFVLLLNIWLTPKYGLIGAALALSLAIFINNVSMVIFLWIKEGLTPFSKGHISTILCLLPSALFLATPFEFNFWVDVFIRNLLFLAIISALIFYFKPVAEIDGFARAMGQKISSVFRKIM